MRFETREQYELWKHAERRREFLEAIQPVLKQKAIIMSSYIPPIFIHADGTMERGPNPEWAQKLLDQCDELIAAIARSFGDLHEDGK